MAAIWAMHFLISITKHSGVTDYPPDHMTQHSMTYLDKKK